MNKSLWVLLLLWVLITALTEIEPDRPAGSKKDSKALVLPAKARTRTHNSLNS